MTMTLTGCLADIESRYLIIFFYVVGCQVKFIKDPTTNIIGTEYDSLWSSDSDIESSYLIIFMLQDGRT